MVILAKIPFGNSCQDSSQETHSSSYQYFCQGTFSKSYQGSCQDFRSISYQYSYICTKIPVEILTIFLFKILVVIVSKVLTKISLVFLLCNFGGLSMAVLKL